MPVDERMIIKSMLFTDIDSLKGAVGSALDRFYDRYDPTVSIKKKDVLDLITDLHHNISDMILYLETRK